MLKKIRLESVGTYLQDLGADPLGHKTPALSPSKTNFMISHDHLFVVNKVTMLIRGLSRSLG
jgi:hypothetical protein